MKEVILIKEGEIALKGLNKSGFEDAFIRNLKRRLNPLGELDYKKAQSTITVSPRGEDVDIDEAVSRSLKVFGAAAVCRAAAVPKDFEELCGFAIDYIGEAVEAVKTFKVEAKRADKKYPLKSPEICAELGGRILNAYPHLSVDVKNPGVIINVEIRDNNAFIHAGNITAAGGIPVGTSGKALILLSGGIDSPVAAYMSAKRGVRLWAVHFESPPYTSERAKLKAERLCEKLSVWCGSITLFYVSLTEVQEAMRENCPEEFQTLLLRRIMVDIAQRIAEQYELQALVTGESIGQVASQTMHAIACTDAVSRYPIFRPLIGMDKIEIIKLARMIETYDISVEPYEDCCTVFTPRHPKIRPVLSEVEAAQSKFDFEPLIKKAMDNIEQKRIIL
ncbi:MAG: tRNA 4-thiouridine(8) synthase ThiI [Oscillospiraceae bacterium]|nr:tRNA 4-thiouridine(8) synthase ThiI [Oscillospiraceae bacterium]